MTKAGSISSEVFEKIDDKILDAVAHFDNICRDTDDIVMFMPDYFNRLFSKFVDDKMIPKQYHPEWDKLCLYKGTTVIEGYENQIVISVRDNVLHNIDPIRIQIP